jgi:hypothetical protein
MAARNADLVIGAVRPADARIATARRVCARS